jgi:hypothetical protein
MNPAFIVTFGRGRYEVADVRAEWTLDQDDLPFCTSCCQQLKFQFEPPDYWQPAWVRCAHHKSHLTPINKL